MPTATAIAAALLFILLFFSEIAAAQDCAQGISSTLGVRRQQTDDGFITATLFAGHQNKQLNLLVLWQQDKLNATVLLPPGHLLVSQEIPPHWFDGRSSLTLERMLFQSRGRVRQWHVAESPEALSPNDPTGTGALNLGRRSPLWASHAAVVFTGSQLHFIAAKPGRLCSAMRALETFVPDSPHSPHARFYMNSPRQHHLKVVDIAGDPYDDATSTLQNVSLHWGVDMAQTLIPPGASRLLEAHHGLHLELDGRVALLTSAQMQKGELAAPFIVDASAALTHASWTQAAHPATQQLVFGRRLLNDLATAWAVDSQGHVAVQFASLVTAASVDDFSSSSSGSGSRADSLPEGILWVAAIFIVFLLGCSAYWTSHLATTLRLHYHAPSENLVDDLGTAGEGGVVTRKDGLVAAAVVVMLVAVSVFVGVYGGHGTLLDANLATPLQHLSLSFWIGTTVLLVFFVVLVALEGFTRYKFLIQTPVISVQLYSVFFGTLVGRGVVSGFLTAAGTTSLQMLVTILVALVLLFFPTCYAALFLWVHVASGQRLYFPAHHAQQVPISSLERSLAIFGFILMLATAVILGVTLPLWLIQPFLDKVNGLYSPVMARTLALVAMSLPILAAVFGIAERGKQVMIQVRTRIARRRAKKKNQ